MKYQKVLNELLMDALHSFDYANSVHATAEQKKEFSKKSRKSLVKAMQITEILYQQQLIDEQQERINVALALMVQS